MRVPSSRLFIGVILAGQFMANVDTAIINVAAPSIGATLHASGAELQVIVSVYVLATAMLLVTAARLGTLYGSRRIFLGGLVTFTLASLGCAVAPDVLALVAARAAQGAGAALMVAQVLSGIQRNLTGDARTRAIGAYTMTLSLSAVSGQILGGILITANLFGLAWRPAFLINVPIGVLLVLLAWRTMPPDDRPSGARPRLDLGGAGLLGLCMLALILPLTLGREMRWPWWTLASLLASAICAGIFVRRLQRLGAAGGAPLLDPALFGEPGVVPGIVAQSFARMTYFSMLFVIALYIQMGLGESALTSGLVLLLWVAAYGIAGSVFAQLPARFAGGYGPAGATLMAGAFAATAAATALRIGTAPVLAVLLGCGGFGFGLLQTALTSRLTASVTKERAGDLSGVLATMTPLSAVIGVATFGSGYLALAVPGGAGPAAHAFVVINVAFALAAGAAGFTAMRAVAESARAARQRRPSTSDNAAPAIRGA